MMTDAMALAADERRDLADFLDTLTDQQWLRPTLCGDWNVRELVTHIVSYEDLTIPQLLAAGARGRFSPNRINEQRRGALADRTPGELTAILRAHLRPRGLTAAFGGAIGLTDALIHHQDIRRPLGMARTIPTERLQVAFKLGFIAPVLPVRANAQGLRLAAPDIGWSRGDGPEVTGPGEALLLALAGRALAIADLSGDGVPILAARLGHP